MCFLERCWNVLHFLSETSYLFLKCEHRHTCNSSLLWRSGDGFQEWVLSCEAVTCNDYLICSSIVKPRKSEIEIKTQKNPMKAEWLTDPLSTVFPNHQQQKLPRTTPPLGGGAPKPSKNFMANPGEPIADSILWFRLLSWHSELAMWSVLLHHSRHDWEYQTQALSEVIYPLSTEPSPRPMFYISVNSFFIFAVFPVVFSFHFSHICQNE